MKKLTLCIGIAVLFLSCASGPDDPNATKPDAYNGYQTWKKVNTSTISGDETGVLGSAHEGSAGFREVYVNATGEAVSGGASLPYPVGSVIVKESFKNAGGSKGDLSSVTIMAKREAGYDPDNGDWEYLMLNPRMKVQAQGRLSGCISCHLAADSDFVFTDNR
jgi:hypothetical protein